MSMLTDATNPFALHLVNGMDYLSWVTQYAYYYAVGLGMRTAILCLESRPITHLLSLIALGSGIPKTDLFTLQVCREHFVALNRALEQLYVNNPIFFENSFLDLDGLISLIRHLKKHEDVETVIIDALHQVRFDGDTPATRAEQRLISSVLQSTAHVGQFHIIAGFYDPYVPFANLPADSGIYCGPEGDEAVKPEPKRIAIAGLAMAIVGRLRTFCTSLFRRIVPLMRQN
jgi:hypothetical protein